MISALFRRKRNNHTQGLVPKNAAQYPNTFPRGKTVAQLTGSAPSVIQLIRACPPSCQLEIKQEEEIIPSILLYSFRNEVVLGVTHNDSIDGLLEIAVGYIGFITIETLEGHSKVIYHTFNAA